MIAKHIYHSLGREKCRRELAELLYKNVLYNEGGIVAINKPYGLKNGMEFDDPVDSKFKNVGEFDFNLNAALPLLANMLSLPELKVARSPEKFASGVTLLKANNDAGIRISRGVKHPNSPAVYSYHAVCYGVPLFKSNEGERLGLAVAKDKDSIATKLTKKPTNTQITTGKMKQVFYSHQVLQTNPDQKVSLVEVSTNRILWYYVPLYLATKLLTPVIGDQIFGNFVKHVFGRPVLLPGSNISGFNPQKLPEEIYKHLELKESDSLSIPNHLHLSSITLYHFSKKEPKHLTIHAPPPPHYQWTCSKLRLWNEPQDLPMELIA